MFKNLLTVACIAMGSILTAQTSIENELNILETSEQIESFLKSKNSKKNKLITFNEEKHKTILSKALFDLPKGGVKTIETEFNTTFYKIVEKSEAIYYRISYITLDGSNMNEADIQLKRTKIIDKYYDGASFDFLARYYSTDDNANKGGDSGWFLKGESHFDIEEAITNDVYNLNDIFTLDAPSSNKFYVILKTFEPKRISEIKVLKIVENKY